MAEVKWIKLKVGMFDGMSFKKIKNAKICGRKSRDILTAVWFELLDFAGKCNHGGAFISPKEIPFTELSEIAMMIDRSEKELSMCMDFFIDEGMITLIDDVYIVSSWGEIQNVESMDMIREQNRLRKQKQREQEKKLLQLSRDSHVTVTEKSREVTLQNNKIKEQDKELYINKADARDARARFTPPTLEEVRGYCAERKNGVDAQKFIDHYTANGWLVGKNKMKDWRAAVRTWEKNDIGLKAQKGSSHNTDDFFEAALARTKNEFMEESV